MTVSVVIPVKNGAAYIAECVGSALAQPETARVVVVDDGSTDGTAHIVRAIADPRLSIVSGERAGVSAARNRGFVELEGVDGWAMFLDADDRLREGALARLLGAARADSVAVYGDYERIDERGRTVGRRSWLKGRLKPSGDILRPLLSGNFIVNGGVMLMRAAAVREAGGFDERLRYCEDWHMFCRLAAQGPIPYLDAIVLDYRVHGESAMMRAPVGFSNYLDAIDTTFGDPVIRGQLAAGEAEKLHARTAAHMRMFLACQALRGRAYLRAAPEAARAIAAAPRHAPRNVIRMLAAAVGF